MCCQGSLCRSGSSSSSGVACEERGHNMVPAGKAELDFVLLGDWNTFSEGSRQFDHYHFSTILMGVFLEGLTPEVDTFLREFSKQFPLPLYERLVRICGPAEPDRDILPWVQRDLDEKR